MLDRQKILDEAYERCMEEMYLKSQPSVSYKQLIQDLKDGKIEDTPENPIYNRYYLSQEEFIYIRDKYIKAYRIQELWHDNIELLEKYLNEGGTKDKWIPERVDEDGFKHPGYRGYEEVPPIKKQIAEFLMHNINGEYVELGDKITEIVMDTIKDCKEFYRFDREHSGFSVSIALGASPTSNPESVKEYWKSQGVDIEIEERNPLLFWERDYYKDAFEEVMIDEYGEDWEKYWNDKWKNELEEKILKRKQKTEEIKKQISSIKD